MYTCPLHVTAPPPPHMYFSPCYCWRQLSRGEGVDVALAEARTELCTVSMYVPSSEYVCTNVYNRCLLKNPRLALSIKMKWNEMKLLFPFTLSGAGLAASNTSMVTPSRDSLKLSLGLPSPAFPIPIDKFSVLAESVPPPFPLIRILWWR